MTTQPEALRLAAVPICDRSITWQSQATIELRRLSEIETLYLAAMRGRHAMSEELLALTAQRDALLEALRGLLALDKEHHQRGHDDEDICQEVQAARAAIKAVEENT